MPHQSISDALKAALQKSGMAYIALERATGVKRGSIMRFLRGETSLRLDKADALAAYLGLTVTTRRQPRKEK